MRIDASPADAMYDEPIAIRLAGFPPGCEVTLRAHALDDLKHRWESRAAFVTDSSGAVDLARQAPKSGSYQTGDAMGLLWSMELDRAVVERGAFHKAMPDPVTVTLEAEVNGTTTAKAELTRRFLAPGVTREVVRDDGLVARFFGHRDGARPGIVFFGGSGGGLAEAHPALLASRGYAVMSLAYFAMEGVPKDLLEIPLEYFATAIAWMRRNPAVRPGQLAVIGSSRGGELALLLGVNFRDVTAVIAYVPSGVVWPGLGPPNEAPRPAWTLGGKGISFIEPAPPDIEAWTKPPTALTPWFLESMKNRESAERAAIAVEKINGPVLMFSGTDDQMWPSLNLADIAMQRLIRLNFPHPHDHVSYAGAGHFIQFPYTPVISAIFHPVVRSMMALGGTPEANHVANLDSWRRLHEFLETHLRRETR
ncbi:MAG TPA: acyl-CoA thioesterase/bile acid-CoA:amino acid N-acyltransferase family protein [Candidatus Binataceae bacterium]